MLMASTGYINYMVHEADVKRVIRGPADLEERIDQLTKQKKLLQYQCRKSGKKIADLMKEIDRLSEENDNLKTMMRAM